MHDLTFAGRSKDIEPPVSEKGFVDASSKRVDSKNKQQTKKMTYRPRWMQRILPTQHLHFYGVYHRCGSVWAYFPNEGEWTPVAYFVLPPSTRWPFAGVISVFLRPAFYCAYTCVGFTFLRMFRFLCLTEPFRVLIAVPLIGLSMLLGKRGTTIWVVCVLPLI